jgi:hypothetical protein
MPTATLFGEGIFNNIEFPITNGTVDFNTNSLKKISTTSITAGATSCSISLSSSYPVQILKIDSLTFPGSDYGSQLNIKVSSNSGSTYLGNYGYAGFGGTGGTAVNATNASYFQAGAGSSSGIAPTPLSGYIWLFNCTSTASYKPIYVEIYERMYSYLVAGYSYENTAAINAISLSVVSTTISSGKITLYGLS